MAPDEIKDANARLNARALEQCGLEIKHFLCPILQVDEDVPLCKGHVIPEALGDSGITVLQRKDVDNFFGSAIEAAFIAVVNDGDRNPIDIFTDPSRHRQHRPTTALGDTTVGHYFPTDESKIPGDHLPAFVADEHGKAVKLVALKITLDEAKKLIEETDAALAEFQCSIEVDRDYIYHALGSVIKIAHLTMFRLFEYRWIDCLAGKDLAAILRKFYYLHKGTTPDFAAVKAYFSPFAQMMKPFFSVDLFQQLAGTLNDNRCVLLYDSNDRPFALGIIVRAKSKRFMVFTYPSLPGFAGEVNWHALLGFFAQAASSVVMEIVEWTGSEWKKLNRYRVNYEPNDFT